MKSERKEAADIVRRLDDAATRAKRGRGLDALKDWDTAEFDGFSTRSSSGLEQLRHWDDAPTSQVIPLTPLPLKDVPAIGPAPSLTATKLASSETETEAKRDLYQAEMPATAPFIQPAIYPVSPPTIISHPTVTSQTTPTSQKQQAALSAPAVAASFSDRGMVSPLKAERLQTRQEPSSGPAATSSLKKHAVGMLQNQAAAPGISSTVKPTAEGAAAPAVRRHRPAVAHREPGVRAVLLGGGRRFGVDRGGGRAHVRALRAAGGDRRRDRQPALRLRACGGGLGDGVRIAARRCGRGRFGPRQSAPAGRAHRHRRGVATAQRGRATAPGVRDP